jgi:hypothetical protein
VKFPVGSWVTPISSSADISSGIPCPNRGIGGGANADSRETSPGRMFAGSIAVGPRSNGKEPPPSLRTGCTSDPASEMGWNARAVWSPARVLMRFCWSPRSVP